MKKYVTVFLFALIMFSVHAAETLLSVEYQYGLSFSKGENIWMYDNPEQQRFSIGEHRINVKTYTFWNNQNIGLFTQAGAALPSFDKTNYNNGYNQNIHIPLSLGAGVGFRHLLSEKAAILYSAGLGFDFRMNLSNSKLDFSVTARKEYRRHIALNLLSDIGYTYSITPNIYINTGANLQFSFAKHLKITTKFVSSNHSLSTTKWAKGYFAFDFLPYIGIGFIINSK